MKITVRENRKSESWGEIADLLRGRGYTPDDESKTLCAYLSLKTGIDTPEEVTVIARYYEDGAELDTEVVAGSYGTSDNDLYSTFIASEERGVDAKQAQQCLRNAEKAAGLYVRALQEIKNG
jgi:hypothetical protein